MVKHTGRIIAILLLALTCVPAVYALDTDVFSCSATNRTPLPVGDADNVLFIIDDSDGLSVSQWQDLTWAWEHLLYNVLPASVPPGERRSAGLMIFNAGNMGAYVAHPVTHIDDPATPPLVPHAWPPADSADEMARVIHMTAINQGRPVQGSLEEAIRYLTGAPVHYGKQRVQTSPQPPSWTRWFGTAAAETRDEYLSHPTSYTGTVSFTPTGCHWDWKTRCENEQMTGDATYINPYQNLGLTGDVTIRVVLVSTGSPSGPNDAAQINSLTGATDCLNDGGSLGSQSDDRCLRSLANYFGATTDLLPNVPGNQMARLTTIAYHADAASQALLADMADLGAGLALTANSETELMQAFETAVFNPLPPIMVEDNTTNFSPYATSLVPPSTPLNPGGLFHHDSDTYFSVFQPTATALWPGNLKRYDFAPDTQRLEGENGVAAFDSTNGHFNAAVQSFWSPSVDGYQAAQGGAASQLPEATGRHLLTDASTESAPFELTPLLPENIAPAQINPSLTDAERDTLIQWARGEADGTAKRIGAPLHSKPAVLVYDDRPDHPTVKVAFFGTTQGYLHAVDANTGREIFGFMPKAVFPQLPMLASQISSNNKPVGLDGSPTLWVQNFGDQRVIGDDPNDRVMLFIGMRRGGSHYYALDVTRPEHPQLVWRISHGKNSQGLADSRFNLLGQSLSTPVVTRVAIKAADDTVTHKDVLLFGGGYDSRQDSATTQSRDQVGNAVYLLDANTGDLLWLATENAPPGGLSLPDMIYSIPSELAVLDINADRLADVIVVGDMGGQVWRFDINNGAPLTDLIRGGRIATLAQAADPQAHRRFFHKPDASLFVKDHHHYLAFAFGSGARPTPLNKTVADHFYVLLTRDVFRAPATYTPVTVSQLTDRTTHLSASVSEYGWYLPLPGVGEKVLATPVTLNGVVIFPTYTPPPEGVTACADIKPVTLWAMNLVDGSVAADYNLTAEGAGEVYLDRGTKLNIAGGAIPQLNFRITETGPALLLGADKLFEGHRFGLSNSGWKSQFWLSE